MDFPSFEIPEDTLKLVKNVPRYSETSFNIPTENRGGNLKFDFFSSSIQGYAEISSNVPPVWAKHATSKLFNKLHIKKSNSH